MQKTNLTAIILTHNEELFLPMCLQSVNWAEEIIVIDKQSTDNTVKIAQQFGAKVIPYTGTAFDQWRNLGLQHATKEWLLYIDPDERVTEDLHREILTVMTQKAENTSLHTWRADKPEEGITYFDIYKFPRQNFWWGREFTACNASPDFVTRLFRREQIKRWTGIIHESPELKGPVGELKSHLIHYTHRDLMSGLRKSYQWTNMEAQLFYKAEHPPVTWWRLAKVTLLAFIKKYFFQKGFTHGTEGFIEAYVQAFNRFMVYEQLWELQQNPRLDRRYNTWAKQQPK